MASHPTNKFLRRKVKPKFPKDEKTIKPRTTSRVKYHKRDMQHAVDKFYGIEQDNEYTDFEYD